MSKNRIIIYRKKRLDLFRTSVTGMQPIENLAAVSIFIKINSHILRLLRWTSKFQ